MRVLFGIILGGLLTVGGAYLYDSNTSMSSKSSVSVANAPTAVHRSLVNWDVVDAEWQHLTARARAEWNRLSG